MLDSLDRVFHGLTRDPVLVQNRLDRLAWNTTRRSQRCRNNKVRTQLNQSVDSVLKITALKSSEDQDPSTSRSELLIQSSCSGKYRIVVVCAVDNRKRFVANNFETAA